MYGGAMQPMVPQFLEESLSAFQRNQSQLRDAMSEAFTAGPFAELAKRNMEMFRAAATGAAAPQGGTAPQGGANEREEEIERLKAQLARLQAKVDKLAS